MNQLVVIPTATGLPTQAKPQLKQLAADLDVLRSLVGSDDGLEDGPREKTHYGMWQAMEALEKFPRDKGRLKHAKYELNCYRQSAVRERLLNGEIEKTNKALLAALPEEAWWGDDNKVKQSAVVKAVGMLLASFPQAVNNAEIFAAQMIEDVLELGPHPYAVEEAWRELRHTKKFTPSISEVRAAYEAAIAKWIDRWAAEDNAEHVAEMLEKQIMQTEEQEKPRAAGRQP
jgi:hypothetical protein